MTLESFRSFSADRAPGSAPLPVQIAAEVRRLITTGALRPGDAIPSSRAVAGDLGVSRGSVTAAYDQLTAEGYLVARPRSATRISSDLTPLTQPPRPGPPPSSPRTTLPTISFLPGHESTGPLADDPTWRASWRDAVRRTPTLDPLGEPALRQAIAQHLRLSRAMVVDPGSIAVTSGARAGLGLLLNVVGSSVPADPRSRLPRVAVESPGFPGLRRLLTQVGVDVVPVPVGADGFHRASLDDAHSARPVDLVLVTPNHQYPLGGALPARARQELIAWARANASLLVEDDYDAEYRHLGPPLPPLWQLDPDVVAHLGTFSSVLSPAVATGYLVVPERLRPAVVAAKAALGATVSPLAQLALARYLDEGGLRKRLGRARRRLAAARAEAAALLAELAEHGQVQDTGHLLVIETPPLVAARWREAAAAKGLLVGDLADGWAGGSPRAGIVVDYGGHEPARVRRALRLLATAAPRTP